MSLLTVLLVLVALNVTRAMGHAAVRETKEVLQTACLAIAVPLGVVIRFYFRNRP